MRKKLEDKIVDKSWGSEYWVHNNEEYCGKRLVFDQTNAHTSMHFHALKRETMMCVHGMFNIDFIDTSTGEEYTVTLHPGESVEIPRLQPHRIRSMKPTGELMEFGTTHYDEDSYRLTAPYVRKG